MWKIFSRIKLSYLFTNPYSSLTRLVLIQLLLMLRPRWNNVEINLLQHCFNVVSTLDTDVVSTLCNGENPTSVLFHRCFIVVLFQAISTLIHNVETTLIRHRNVGWEEGRHEQIIILRTTERKKMWNFVFH